ncbi:MAG: hypothetical protein WEB87_05550 [Bacteriovoracaceae bacterium]
MENVANSQFESLALPSESEIQILKDDCLLVKKWRWDYQECLRFQKRAQELVRANRRLKIYIFCNHPHCFTLGRGNERGREDLTDFDPSSSFELKFPLHKVHRGGGITFHYPGQWIFYPIVSIGPSYTLEDHMCWLLKSVANVLKERFGLLDVVAAKKLMGVWKDKKKLASIGVGVARFVTEHGLALNLAHDQLMFEELAKINPCGMTSEKYASVDSFAQAPQLLELFHKQYLQSLK